jgi:hypothetical protein
MYQRLKRMTLAVLSALCRARHCLVEGGVEGVPERGALETIVVADRVFAAELHLRCAQDHFESGRRMDFGRLGLIIAMSIQLEGGVKCFRAKMTVESKQESELTRSQVRWVPLSTHIAAREIGFSEEERTGRRERLG